jgi:predicted Zn-dependent protease
VENRADRLLAAPPANDAMLQVVLEDLNKRVSPRQFMTRRLGLEPRSGQTLRAGEPPAYTALDWAGTPFGKRLTRFTVVYFRDKVYVFAGARRNPDDRRKYRTEFLNTALSLRGLRAEEFELARGRKLALLRASADTRYTRLAHESELASYAEAQLRLLNGDYPRGQPAPGKLMKVID